MKDIIYQISAMLVSGLVSVNLSMKYSWSKKFWKLINRKIKLDYNAMLFVLLSTFLGLIVMFILDFAGIRYPVNAVIMGIVLGFYIAFVPDLGNKNRKKENNNL